MEIPGIVVFLLGFIALSLFWIGSSLSHMRRDVEEIWKRMKRID